MKREWAKTFFILSLIVLLITTGIYANVMFDSKSDETEEAVVVKKGSTGSQVKTIQTKLKNWGYYKGSVDGIFGSKTEAAVKYFQKSNGLVSDGIVGSKTAAALGMSLSSSSSSNSSYSGTDEFLLAKAVHAEARGEPYLGMVAVAAVILNRVRHPDFPNSISTVIYQPWAFTSVHDGQINLTPNETSKKAARDALNGWDPTNGCIFFYNPATSTSVWITSRKTVTTIGTHRFCL